ncbi:hypothetical protein D1872_211860 [compost metagenome]
MDSMNYGTIFILLSTFHRLFSFYALAYLKVKKWQEPKALNERRHQMLNIYIQSLWLLKVTVHLLNE